MFSYSNKIQSQTYTVCNDSQEFTELIYHSKNLLHQGAAKEQLPVVTVHAVYDGEPRTNHTGRRNGMYLFENDDEQVNPVELYNNKIMGHEKELGIAYMERSYNGKTHIWAVCPQGMGIQQSQQWLSQQLGIGYDEVCRDKARGMFVTGDVIYRDDKLLFLPIPEQIEEEVVEQKEESILDLKATTSDTGDNCRVVPTEYMGIPYTELINELIKVMGGEPQLGNRNTFIYRLVSCLRGICDNDANLLQSITPSFGLSEKEVAAIIKSATKEPVKGVWKEMKHTLAYFGAAAKEWWRVDDDLIYVYTQDVMRNLPLGLKEVIMKIPENKKMNVLCAILPVLATYTENIIFHHATGEEGHMILMGAIIGDFGKGKSSLCKQACDLFMTPINEQDKPGWEANEEYYETQQTRGANENAGKKPHPVIRNIASVATTPYILERLKHSKGHSLVCVTAEVQDMNSNPADNKDRSKLLRKSFDEEEHAVGRVGKESITGKVKVRLNTTVMGTFNAVQTFFGDGNIENGLASRFIISFLPHEVGQQWLNYKGYDEKTRKAAHQLTEILSNRCDEVKTPRIDKAIRQWWEEKNQLVIEHNDSVLGSLINRMAVIGHRCGTLFHVMTGKKKETQTSVKFALLMAEYTLREQLRFFGSTLKQLAEQQTALKIMPTSHNKKLLASLPDTFSFEDAKALKPDVKGDSVKRMLQRWASENLIEHIGVHQYRKK